MVFFIVLFFCVCCLPGYKKHDIIAISFVSHTQCSFTMTSLVAVTFSSLTVFLPFSPTSSLPLYLLLSHLLVSLSLSFTSTRFSLASYRPSPPRLCLSQPIAPSSPPLFTFTRLQLNDCIAEKCVGDCDIAQKHRIFRLRHCGSINMYDLYKSSLF